MKNILTLVISLSIGTTVNGQCTANYSYIGTTDTLTFTNISTIPNAHYYWNFGDGSGSNDFSPTHVFPDDGKYLVTLYGVDTLTNCVDVIENWINVIKPDTLACIIYFTDTIIGNSPQTTNLSTNCWGFNLGCHVFANAMNICNGFSLGSWNNALFLHGMRATSNDSIYGSRIFNAYYKTLPYNYSSATNYQNCSANFEVKIDYQVNGAYVTLTAMNKSGNSTFTIIGFGNSIILPGVTASYMYPYITYSDVFPWLITHTKSDTLNSCSSVSSTQCILIRNPYYKWPSNCVISQQPQTQFGNLGTSAQFIIDAPDNVAKQWQQDAGLGYVNLTNAGPYSGVYTDTLTISNIQLTMNNYYYRCVISDSSGFGCHNTSSSAVLQVVDIEEIQLPKYTIFPNPTSNSLTLDLPFAFSEASASIYNVLGAKYFDGTIKKSQTTFDLSFLTSGVYFIEVIADKKVGRQMFVKF